MKSSLKNMVLMLSLITFIASAAVGVVYQLTKDPIQNAKLGKLNDTILEVLPAFTELAEVVVVEIDGEKVSVYPAMEGDNIVGYAVESFSKNGFSGMIKVLVGFRADGTVHSSSVISHAETPGLGDKMEKSKSDFSLQFDGVDPKVLNLTVKNDGGDIDAITAATISSRAYTDAIANGYKAYQQVVAK